MRRGGLVMFAMGLASMAWIASPSPARAECSYFVIPSVTVAAASAQEVIVGTVVENLDDHQQYDYSLRIDHVLRGPARVGDIRRITFLYPNWPPLELPDGTKLAPCDAIPGWEGNVIAFSLDALAPDGVTRYNAAAWISGNFPRDMPRTTLTEIAAAAGMPSTDTGDAAPLAERDSSLPVIALAVITTTLLAVHRFERQRRLLRHSDR